MPPDALRGLVVATVLPFEGGGAIDWRSYETLIAFCGVPATVRAVFVNGHAGEGAALTPAERVEVIRRTRAMIGAKPLMAGIIAFSTAEAIAETERALAAGADIAVLFPPPAFAAGGTRTPEVPLAFVRAVREATGATLGIFQQPLASGLGFTTETLAAMAAMPGVVAIKEGSDSMAANEDNWRAVKQAAPGCAVLPSDFDWFLAQCAVGADGILSGLGSLCPRRLHALWAATEAADLAAMRRAAAGSRARWWRWPPRSSAGSAAACS